MNVRTARSNDLSEVLSIVNGADLAVSRVNVEEQVGTDQVLVAESECETLLGTLLAIPRPTGAHVEAIAVRPGRRGQGIGSDLVSEAASRWELLTADFRPSVTDFYRANGFDVEPSGVRRFGTLK